MGDLDSWMIHTATVETYGGTGSAGEIYGAPVSKVCYAEDGTMLTVGPNGDVLIAVTKLYGPLSDVPAYTSGTRVTVNGKTGHVVTAERYDGDLLGLPSHVAVTVK